MKETLASLSQKTGYSITTISRVLSGKSEQYRISKETQDTILEAAKKNNYFPNIVAQNLRTNKTDTIGLMVPELANPYFADIASTIVCEARRYNYTTKSSIPQRTQLSKRTEYLRSCPDRWRAS